MLESPAGKPSWKAQLAMSYRRLSGSLLSDHWSSGLPVDAALRCTCHAVRKGQVWEAEPRHSSMAGYRSKRPFTAMASRSCSMTNLHQQQDQAP